MDFEWDSRKDIANRHKHGIEFREATTVFGDPLAMTFPDEDHSLSERRFLTIGSSISGQVLVVAHTENPEIIRIISARPVTRRERRFMKKAINRKNHSGMRPEYDFASMKNGVQGKHYERYKQSTNVVVLSPDVAEAFPTENAVNEALRGILSTTRAVRRTGGLPDHAMQATSIRHKRSGRRS
jgi:uncharacterized DUF497 family protein